MIALPQGGRRRSKRAKTPGKSAAALQTEPLLKRKAIELAHKLQIARTRDFADIGISRPYLRKLCKEGLLIRVGHGLYRAAEEAA